MNADAITDLEIQTQYLNFLDELRTCEGFHWHLRQNRIRATHHRMGAHCFCPIEAVYYSRTGNTKHPDGPHAGLGVHNTAHVLGYWHISWEIVHAADEDPFGVLGTRIRNAVGIAGDKLLRRRKLQDQ